VDYKLNKVLSVSPSGHGRAFDIEVNDDRHAFVAKSPDGAIGISHNSACISLSNLSDDRMRHAKSGEWWKVAPHRALANNSICFTEKPEIEVFMREWLALIESKSGERGLINRVALKRQVERTGRRDPNHDFIVNPCSEIILRDRSMCNLSEVVVRPNDSKETLKNKIRLATILGTMQATLTNFQYISEKWKKNTEEEALLGVSLTGVYDNPLTYGANGKRQLGELLDELRLYAVEVNKEWAGKLGINQAMAVTTLKPSGCRPADALTSTTKGLLRLDEILESHNEMDGQWKGVSNIDAYQENGAVSPISKTYRNGMSRVLSIRMSFNLVVESTEEHPWFVVGKHNHRFYPVEGKWVPAGEIKTGMVLDINRRAYRNDSSLELKLVRREDMPCNLVFDIKQPTHMNEDLAWLLGYLWGDGAMSPYKWRLRWTDGEDINLLKAQRIVLEQFGLHSEIKPCDDGRDARELAVASRMLWEWCVLNEVWKYNDDGSVADIPKIVRASSWKHIVAFLSGLFDADGCISVSGNMQTGCIATAHDGFAKHVQNVGWSVGVCLGRSLNSKGANFQKKKHIWLMSFTSAMDAEAMSVMITNSNRLSRIPSPLPWIWGSKSGRRYIGKVVSVSDEGCKPTFDIEDDSHWFWAGAVKSHNTVSALVDCASGIHPRFAKIYTRRVRASVNDPLTKLMIEQGFVHEPDTTDRANTVVFSFPMKAPAGCVGGTIKALDHLELWKTYHEHWTEHQPSITVYVREDEWLDVGAWVYRNFDIASGIAFLPYCGHTYAQMPFEAITDVQYDELLAKQPAGVDWGALAKYEQEDNTVCSQTYACQGDKCEIV
jgi:hypothetical protein